MASTIKGLNVKIGAETTGLTAALKDVNTQSTNIAKELKKVETGLKFNPKDTTLLAQKQKLLGDQVATTREKLDKLKLAEADVQKQFENGDIGEEQYRAFQREVVETESKLEHYETQLKEVKETQRLAGSSAEDMGKKLSAAGDKMKTVGKNMSMYVTAPIAGLAVIASKIGIDFEKAMSEVQSVSGATAEELNTLEDAARDAGATTNKSATEAADALKYMGLAGWDVKESQEALMPVLKLSSAANMDLGTASDLVTDSMSALGLEVDDLDNYLDVMAQTSRNSNTSVEQLGEAFVTSGGKLKALKISASDGAVALGLLANNGIKGSEAGKGLSSILTNLTAPVGRAKIALEELNVSAFDSNGEFIGIQETLQLVEDATEGMTDEQKNLYASMIAGKEQTKTYNALISGLDGGFEDLTGSVEGADGALEEMYETSTDNTLGAIEELKSAVQELALKVFDNLKPAFEKITKVLKDVTDKFNAMTPEGQKVALVVAGIAAATGPLLVIFGTMSSSIGSIISLFAKFTAASKVATTATVAQGSAIGATSLATKVATLAQAAFNAVLALNPIMLAVMALGAMVAVLAIASLKTKELSEDEKEFNTEIKEANQNMTDYNSTMGDLADARKEAISDGVGELNYYQNLNTELDTLVDKNGNVKKGYEDRANFIVTTLNEALGFEIEMNNGVITSYEGISQSIDDLIEKKKAQIILNSYEAEYTAAVKDHQKSIEDAALAYQVFQTAQKEYDEAAKTSTTIMGGGNDALREKKEALDIASDTYDDYTEREVNNGNIINDFETLSTEIAKGNYQTVTDSAGKLGEALVDLSELDIKELNKRKEKLKNYVDESERTYEDTGNELFRIAAEKGQEQLDLVETQLSERASTVSNNTSIQDGFKKVGENSTKEIKTNMNKGAVEFGNGIDLMKGKTNFTWDLPSLKMPSIYTSGKFGLNPITAPKFGIKWNAEGGIFTRPTVIPTMSGLQGFAEPSTGGEAILPLNRLSGIIADAMSQFGGGGDTIVIKEMVVRDDTDIDKIARKLDNLRVQKMRGGRI